MREDRHRLGKNTQEGCSVRIECDQANTLKHNVKISQSVLSKNYISFTQKL